VPRNEAGIFTTRKPNANHLVATSDLTRTERHLDEDLVLLTTCAIYIYNTFHCIDATVRATLEGCEMLAPSIWNLAALWVAY
jgi:hypothetical protein